MSVFRVNPANVPNVTFREQNRLVPQPQGYVRGLKTHLHCPVFAAVPQFVSSVSHVDIEPFQIGSRGITISLVQWALAFSHVDKSLVADGIFGPKTRAALMKFQQSMRFLEPSASSLKIDGRLDGPTLGALDRFIARIVKESQDRLN